MEKSNKMNNGIPMPIVTLNRAFLTFGILIAMLTNQIWITTLIFIIILPVAILGKRYSLIYYVGSKLFAKQIINSDYEDAALQRFNNTIAASLLALSQLFFMLNQSIVGWVFTGMVMAASGVALLGFCVGCFLYYQFKIQRYKIFGP